MLGTMSKTLNLLLSTAMVLAGMVGTAHAVKVFEKGDRFLSIGGFIQPRLELNFDRPGAPTMDAMGNEVASDDTQLGTDFYIRRTRLIFAGKVHKKWGFKVITLDLNDGHVAGPQGYGVGDAWMTYSHSPALHIDFGLQRVAFTRHNAQGGSSIHGMDFHGMFVKRPGYAALPGRDFGLNFRGLLLNKKIDYRVAIVDGLDDGSDTRLPRVVARVAYNLFDPTPEKYFKGTYLGKKKVVQFGLSADVQPGVGGEKGEDLYGIYAVDTLIDLPMGDNGIVFTGNVILYGAPDALPAVGGRTGMGVWADLGYRIGDIEPLVAVEMCMPDNDDADSHAGECLGIRGGLNWWIKGHTVNLKAEYGMIKWGTKTDEGEFVKNFIVQTHLFF